MVSSYTTEQMQGRPLRRFFRLLAPDRQEVLYIYLFAIFSGLINLSLPLGIQAIIGLTLADTLSTSWIILIAVVTIGTLMAGGLQIMQLSITERLQQQVFARASFEFAFRLPRIQMAALDRYYPPELINRFFDVVNVQKALPKLLIDFSTALLQMIFGLVLLSFYNSAFVFFGIGLLLILALIFRISGPRGMKTSMEESDYKYEVAYWLEEIARTLATFKLAGKTDLAMRRTNDLVSNYLGARKAHFKVLVFQYFNIIGFKTLVTAGLLILGSILLIEREINLGQFVASEIIILIIIASVEKLVLSMDTIYDVLTALEKIGKVTDLPLEATTGFDFGEAYPKGNMAVKVREMSFTFPGEQYPSLRNISLEAKAGERICISGASGSGKTMLLNVLAGIYPGVEGHLAYNGLPINNYNIRSLRNDIGEVLSQKTLFRGTILDNLTMGREGVSHQEVMKALEQLGLQGYIESLPDGLNTLLVPEGPQLPQTIVRRMLIAKPILRRPQLLIVDDLLSSTRQEVREDIFRFLCMEECWTLIGASNDPAFASQCDRVYVMAQGEMIDQGPFEAIFERNPQLFQA